MTPPHVKLLLLWLWLLHSVTSFQVPIARKLSASSTTTRFWSAKNDDDEAARLKAQAEQLRQQIDKMERDLGRPEVDARERGEEAEKGMSLSGKKVLVVGANGRLGSMVCRYMLRNNADTKVVAAVHYVGSGGEDGAPTSTRGYGRLSYEVGAEDGIGTIGPAWSADDRTASFLYSDEMKEYNLQNLRVVPVELLDPVQCNTITEGIDSVVWCATDFNGNTPRAVSGLNVAFLFRAVADPTKGRVEIEGLRNILGGLKSNKQTAAWNESGGAESVFKSSSSSTNNDPIDFALVSVQPLALEDFETPFGSFRSIKQEGEDMLKNEFPSLKYTILQMARYDDNFVDESLDVNLDDVPLEKDSEQAVTDQRRRRINRRDAARAASECLTNENLVNKAVQVWTATRGK